MVSSVGKFLGSRDQKIADEFHSSGAAKLCPPDNSAHISAHNAVRSIETVERQRVSSYLRARHQEKLDRNYERAQKRAQKKGRELPPKDEYYNHWGYSYYSMVAACPSHAASFTNALPVYSPFMFPYYYAPGLYYGWDPCYVNAGAGAWGACAAGTCGAGGVGGCGGVGACGSAAVSRTPASSQLLLIAGTDEARGARAAAPVVVEEQEAVEEEVVAEEEEEVVVEAAAEAAEAAAAAVGSLPGMRHGFARLTGSTGC